MYKNT